MLTEECNCKGRMPLQMVSIQTLLGKLKDNEFFRTNLNKRTLGQTYGPENLKILFPSLSHTGLLLWMRSMCCYSCNIVGELIADFINTVY
jgi:hypothetical protein